MAGYVLYNGFWNPQGPPDAAARLAEAGQKRGADWTAVPNTALFAQLGDRVRIEPLTPQDYVLFWDKDVRLGQAMEAMGIRLYNPAAAVALCDDKAATHLALSGQGIPMPRTWVAPMTYAAMDEQGDRFLARAAADLGFPLVVKECYGSLGGQVYLARGWEELLALARGMGSKPFLLQEYVAAHAGEDARLYVVDGTVVAAMRRHSQTDFRANIGHGGTGERYTPTAQEEELALRACSLLGTAIAGVDLLWDAAGRPLVCEVNSNAQMAAIMACTGVDVAGEIADYVLRQERRRLSAAEGMSSKNPRS